MTTSNSEAYVWIWLPDETKPMVAGLLSKAGKELHFNYGKSYLARENAIAIYDSELPLKAGAIPLVQGLSMPSCIRDASPDAWGRRVLMPRELRQKGSSDARLEEPRELEELTYLLESGSDRIGALDFQRSSTHYRPRTSDQASLEELMQSAERVEQGVPLQPDLDKALQRASSIGGARPKALLSSDERKFVAKFSTTNDLYNVVKAEFVAMRLAKLVGLHVAEVRLTRALGKDVLLVERFDRERSLGGWLRKPVVSALTLFGLDAMMAKYASYQDLAEIIRHRFTNPAATLREIYGRLVFNILCGNTDDHARNHAAFWDGKSLTLTPAYDVCPQARTGGEASQAMLIHGNNRMSQLAVCMEAAPNFLLRAEEAKGIIQHQVKGIRDGWKGVCEEARMTEADRQFFWQRQFLNSYAFYGAPEEIRGG